jgi:hypothetical protein
MKDVKKETSQWIVNNYLCAICHSSILNNLFGYIHHEEQYVTNHSHIIYWIIHLQIHILVYLKRS